MSELGVVESAPFQAELLKQCRLALGYTVEQLQDALCLMDARAVLNMERGTNSIYGSAWVALRFLLEDRWAELDELSEADLAGEHDQEMSRLDELIGRVGAHIATIQKAAKQRREQTNQRRTPANRVGRAAARRPHRRIIR